MSGLFSKDLSLFFQYFYFSLCFSGPARTVLKERDQVVSAESEKKAKVKPAAKTANYHKIDYLTTEQFDSVPQ